jgi:CarboxypepD_reg-like domain/Gram-negative bacterial TonB protein C-terminal
MNNEKIYTVADFANYYAGKMPASEMHALEKAALEDPFLEDALEGYAHTNNAIADIELLKEKLATKEKSETKVFAISSNRNWMRAAASIVIVFGLGYLFYTLNKKEDSQSSFADNKIKQEIKVDTNTTDTNKTNITTNEIAAQEKDLTIQSQTTISPSNSKLKFDTTTLRLTDNNLSGTTAPTATLQQHPASSPTIQTGEVAIKSDDTKPLQKDAPLDNIQTKEKALDLTQNNRVQNNAINYYNYSGIVQSPTGGPMQNATVKLKNTNIATQTDNKGRFYFKANDSIANVSIAALGYDKKEALINSNTTQIFKLDSKNSNLDEVVVTGVGTKRKSASVGYSTTTIDKTLAGKVSGVNVSTPENEKYADLKKIKEQKIDSSRFNEETKAFYNYTKQHIKPEFDDNGKEYKGKVILSFITNKKGKPSKIKIEQSLNESCNEQAIQLLEQGPRWSKNIKDRQKVTVEF